MRRWMAGVAMWLCVAGCKRFSNDSADPAATAVAPAPVQTATATANSASGEVTGIPECDALLVVFSCYMKNSGVPNWELSIQQMRDGFRQSATSPSGRQTTAAACKLQMSTQQANFARVGCSSNAGPGGSAGLGGPSGAPNLR